MRSSHERPAWADTPIVGREYWKEASRCMIQVRFQIHVNDTGLVLHNRLCHAQDGVMGRAFWAIAVRTRLEVRFKDGLQDELEGSLDHTVTDRRNRQHADTLPTALRNGLVP